MIRHNSLRLRIRRLIRALPSILILVPGLLTPRGGLAAPSRAPTEFAAKGTRAYWVFFRDRGAATERSIDLVSLAERIPPEAWARGERCALDDCRCTSDPVAIGFHLARGRGLTQ